MRLKPSPLFSICVGKNIKIDSVVIDELNLFISEHNYHPFRNMTAVIYYNLKKLGYLNRLPKRLYENLKQMYYLSVASDMNQRSWLEKFIKRDLPDDIEIILIKGSANWGTIYSPEAPRTSCDIDILVREKDFERVVNIIKKQGKKNILDEKRVYTNEKSYEYSFTINNLPVSVEIHRRLSYPFVGNVDYKLLFERSQPHPYYEDDRVKILRPIERIVHILIHTIKHAYINIHEIIDSYLILKKYRITPESVIDNSVSYKLSGYAMLFMNLISELVDAKEILSARSFDQSFYFKKRIFDLLFRKEYRFNNRLKQLISLLLIDDISDCLRFLQFYAGIRVKDILYYYLPLKAGRRYE